MDLRTAALISICTASCRSLDAPAAPSVVDRFCTAPSQCSLATFHTRRTPVAQRARVRAEAWLRTLPRVELAPQRDVKICRHFQCGTVRQNETAAAIVKITAAGSEDLRF